MAASQDHTLAGSSQSLKLTVTDPSVHANAAFTHLSAVTVGVPVMVHVPLVRLMPVGKEGEMAHVAPLTAPDGLIVHVMSGLKDVLRMMNAPSALGVSVQFRPSVKVMLVDPPLLLAKTV